MNPMLLGVKQVTPLQCFGAQSTEEQKTQQFVTNNFFQQNDIFQNYQSSLQSFTKKLYKKANEMLTSRMLSVLQCKKRSYQYRDI